MNQKRTVYLVGVEGKVSESLASTFERLGCLVKTSEDAQDFCVRQEEDTDVIVAGPGLSQEEEYDLVKTIRLSGNRAPILTFTTRVKPSERDLGWRIALDSACIAAISSIFGGVALEKARTRVGFNVFTCSQRSIGQAFSYWKRSVRAI